VETTPRSRNSAHGIVEVRVWSCGFVVDLLRLLRCEMWNACCKPPECLTRRLAAVSAGWIRRALVQDSVHHRLCELMVIGDLGGI
jgi:hypothetical protein